MYMHPDQQLWMVEQDRERGMAQRALERAARSGGQNQPGLVRGGISEFARILREAGSTARNFRVNGHGSGTDLSGAAGV